MLRVVAGRLRVPTSLHIVHVVFAGLALTGAAMVTGPRAQAEFLRADIAKWQKVIRDSNIVLE
jgi:hypothetical protein